MSIVARIKTAMGEVEAGQISTTSGGWLEFKKAVLGFENISELEKLTEHGSADDGLALREDLEAILATFELSESSKGIAEGLLKIAAVMGPGDVLIVTE